MMKVNRSVSAGAAKHFDQAFALINAGMLAEAYAEFTKAMMQDSTVCDLALQGQAMIAANRGDWLDAERILQQLLAIDSHQPQAWNQLSWVLEKLQRHTQAKDARATAFKAQANLHIQQKHYAEAAACMRKALEIYPEDTELWKKSGLTFASAKNDAEAEFCFRQALSCDPHNSETLIEFGFFLAYRDKRDEALRCAQEAKQQLPADTSLSFRKSLGVLFLRCQAEEEAKIQFDACLQADADDALGVRLLLADSHLPARAPEALLHQVYHERAEKWGAKELPNYYGARLVAEALSSLTKSAKEIDILDVGCGTGFVGMHIHAQARRLVGIDLSEAMLEKAKLRGIYHELWQGEMVSLMCKQPTDNFDAVTSAATLIHFGDLQPVFAAAAHTLRPGGLFIFTLFPREEGDFGAAPLELARAGCYAHSENYVRRTARATGFAVEMLDKKVHEVTRHGPRMGLIVGLRLKV